MAVPITDKPNTDAPSGSYPYGNIRDNDGTNNGTPVNKLVYADFHQFFARLMAVTSTAYNSLVENATNGFQYIAALETFVRGCAASTGAKGTIEIATNAEFNAGTDDERAIVAKNVMDSPTLIHNVTTAVRLATKIVEIGDWNMDSTNSVQVVHGLSDITKIRSIEVIIKNDSSLNVFKLETADRLTGLSTGGYIDQVTSTEIYMNRVNGGLFDSTDFNSTSYNRGWITILYQTN